LNKPQLGHTKPSTEPHATPGPWVGHSCFKRNQQVIKICDIHHVTFIFNELHSAGETSKKAMINF